MSDILNELRKRHRNVTGGNPLIEPIKGPTIFSEAADELKRLRAECERVTAERDEARREVLLWVKERCSWVELSDEIKKRGWEYLKEDGK